MVGPYKSSALAAQKTTVGLAGGWQTKGKEHKQLTGVDTRITRI